MTLKDNAKYLRSHMTDAESKLWYHLRSHRFAHLKFKRQKPIGAFIVDFVCMQQGLIIEVDGSQHWQSKADKRRDTWLSEQGFRVLRFWDNDVLLNFAAVLEAIYQAAFPSPLTPLPQAGEGDSAAPIPALLCETPRSFVDKGSTPFSYENQAPPPRPLAGEGNSAASVPALLCESPRPFVEKGSTPFPCENQEHSPRPLAGEGLGERVAASTHTSFVIH